MRTTDQLANPARKSGFAHVRKRSTHARSRPFQAYDGPGGLTWIGPGRATALEAAQDYCDYVNGNPAAGQPSRIMEFPREQRKFKRGKGRSKGRLVGEGFTPKMRKFITKRADKRCENPWCTLHTANAQRLAAGVRVSKLFQCHHIDKDGFNHPDNGALLCRPCHLAADLYPERNDLLRAKRARETA